MRRWPQVSTSPTQISQLIEFYEEHGHGEDGLLFRSILIRVVPNLGTGYLEMLTLDEDGELTDDKRVLFPT